MTGRNWSGSHRLRGFVGGPDIRSRVFHEVDRCKQAQNSSFGDVKILLRCINLTQLTDQ
jgi:hypothetical protein